MCHHCMTPCSCKYGIADSRSDLTRTIASAQLSGDNSQVNQLIVLSSTTNIAFNATSGFDIWDVFIDGATTQLALLGVVQPG